MVQKENKRILKSKFINVKKLKNHLSPQFWRKITVFVLQYNDHHVSKVSMPIANIPSRGGVKSYTFLKLST